MSTFGQLGQAVGSVIGAYYGGAYGQIAGSLIGGYIGSSFDPTIVNSGPRISDLKLQNGSYGTPISVSFGTSRISGTVIFLTDIREHKTETDVGKGGQKTVDDTFSYDMDVAVVLTDQHGFPVKGITGVRRIWANGALVWSNAETASLGTLIASTNLCQQVTIYPGDYDQLPDPTIEAAVGSGNATAYRGFAYGVFKGLAVTQQGSPVPQFEFEVVQGGVVSVAKQVFASHPMSETERLRPLASWVGRDKAMGTNYRTSDATVLITYFWNAGDAQAEVTEQIDPFDPGTSGFEPFFVNCTTAPYMASINYPTGTPTDGMVLTIRGMRGTGTPDEDGLVSFGTFVTKTIPVVSYPDYTMTASNRVALEELTGYYAYSGAAFGIGTYYASHIGFVGGSEFDTICALPADRSVIDIGIYLGILYAWNLDNIQTPDGYATYITAFDSTGSMLFDESHFVGLTDNTSAIEGGRICVNEFGTFTWASTFVHKFLVGGSVLLCPECDYLTVTEPDARWGRGFWTDGRIANIGASNIISTPDPQTAYYATVQFAALTKGSVSLNYALSIIATIAGLVPDEIDVTQQTQTLRGYAYKQIGAATSFLQPLCTTFFVEGFESEGKLRFSNLGGPTVADIPFDDLGYGPADGDIAEPFPLVRMQEKDLPRSVSVVYANWDADFQVGSEPPAKRLITSSVNDIVIETPITATADESIKRQDILLYKAWLERDTRTTSLSRKWVALDTSDPVNVEYPSGTWRRYRISRVEYQGVFSNYEFVRDEPDVLISTTRGSNVAREQAGVQLPGTTLVRLLDIPLLRDSDDGAGFYAAFASYATVWPGADLLKLQTTGAYQSVGGVTARTYIGSAMTVLGDWDGGNLFDNENVVRVNMGSGTLSNATAISVVTSNVNAILLGNEIVQFCHATLISTGIYDLSGLLRYRRGTEQAAAHQIGERAVLLQTGGIRRILDQLSDRDVPETFKAVTSGQDVTTAGPTVFSDHEVGLMPFAPVDLRVDVSTNPVGLSWHRRSRLSGRLFQPVPLGEAIEAYEIDVENSGGTVTATLRSATPYVGLSAFDAGSTATVYQISAAVGRGFGSTIALPGVGPAPIVAPPTPTPPVISNGPPLVGGSNGSTVFAWENTSNASELAIYISTDSGATFTRHTSSTLPAPSVLTVFANGLYIATLPNSPWTYTSTDLVNWAGVNDPGGWQSGVPLWTGSEWVKAAEGPDFKLYVYTSSDGITWTRGAALPTGATFELSLFGGVFFNINAASTGYSIYSSSDLATWTKIASTQLATNPPLAALNSWLALASDGTNIVALGSKQNNPWDAVVLIMRSTDGGATFSDVSPTLSSATQPSKPVAFDSAFIAPGWAGGFIKSTDGGATWTEHVLTPAKRLVAPLVVSASVLVCDYGPTAPTDIGGGTVQWTVDGILTTTDLVTWDIAGGGSLTAS